MKSEVLEVLACPALGLPRSQVTPLALHAQGPQPAYHVGVQRTELTSGIPRAEVVPPTPQHGIKVADDFADIRVASRPRGQRLHALPDPLHRAPTRPALQEVQALMLPLPQPTAHALVQVTAEKVKPLVAIVELDSSRFLLV